MRSVLRLGIVRCSTRIEKIRDENIGHRFERPGGQRAGARAGKSRAHHLPSGAARNSCEQRIPGRISSCVESVHGRTRRRRSRRGRRREPRRCIHSRWPVDCRTKIGVAYEPRRYHSRTNSCAGKNERRPSVLVSASATGIYGNRGDELLTEDSQPGDDFLSSLAKEWEAEALKAEAIGIRVVLARFGIVLARNGGALPKMMLPFRFFAGGRICSGQQWMSWISLDDAIEILRLALENGEIRGPINLDLAATSPKR